jgi:ligand-binding sensor domain-containing protein
LDQSTQPSLAGSVPQDPSYVVIGGIGVDSKGSTWIVNRSAINGNHLAQIFGKDSARYRTSPSEGVFTNIVVDHNNTKWLANAEPNNKPATGLFYFNEDTLVSGTRITGGWGWMMQGDGLPNNSILSLAVDLDGDVCVGTDIGMIIITEPSNPKAASKLSSFPLRGQSVQAIAVDAVGNKWVGTKEGVIVLTPDAIQLLTQYSVLSTAGKLVDDDVRSIAIDQRRGIIYFGTEKGLSSLEITPVQTARSFSSLEIGPNPYVIPGSQPLTIRNLVPESSIKIVSVNGALISEFQAQGGGRAFWNGQDVTGQLVPSGVYFVVAFAENGNQIITGKVAVVRR